jgi:hypothetical protein
MTSAHMADHRRSGQHSNADRHGVECSTDFFHCGPAQRHWWERGQEALERAPTVALAVGEVSPAIQLSTSISSDVAEVAQKVVGDPRLSLEERYGSHDG